MKEKVKIKFVKEKVVNEFTFEHAQAMLRIDKRGAFSIAEPKKWQFDGKNLIKQPKKKADKE